MKKGNWCESLCKNIWVAAPPLSEGLAFFRHPPPPTLRSYSNQHKKVVPVTVTGTKPKTTKDLAAEMGMSESSYQKRSKIGRGLSEEVQEIIGDLDPSESDLPNSTRQLNYLAGVDDPDLQRMHG